MHTDRCIEPARLQISWNKIYWHQKQCKHSLLFSVSVLLFCFVRDFRLTIVFQCRVTLTHRLTEEPHWTASRGIERGPPPTRVGPRKAALGFTARHAAALCRSPGWLLWPSPDYILENVGGGEDVNLWINSSQASFFQVAQNIHIASKCY